MSLFKLSVKSQEVSIRTGEKNGRPWSLKTQDDCFIDINGETRRLPLTLSNDQPAHHVGEYQFDASKLIAVGRYGLEIDRYKPIILISILSDQKMPLKKAS